MRNCIFALMDRNIIISSSDYKIQVDKVSNWGQRTSHQVVLYTNNFTETLYEGTEAECMEFFKTEVCDKLKDPQIPTEQIIECDGTVGSLNGIATFITDECKSKAGFVLPIDYVYERYLIFAKKKFPLKPVGKWWTDRYKHDYPRRLEFVQLFAEQYSGFQTIGVEEGQFVLDIEIKDKLSKPIVKPETLQEIANKRRALAMLPLG